MALLVPAQFGAIVALDWPGPARWRLPPWLRTVSAVMVLGGVALSLAGAKELGAALTPAVEPVRDAALRTRGVYALSRHPVYAGLLPAASGAAVLRRRPEPLVALAVLGGVLHLKSAAEEERLRVRLREDWNRYAASTPRLPGRRQSG